MAFGDLLAAGRGSEPHRPRGYQPCLVPDGGHSPGCAACHARRQCHRPGCLITYEGPGAGGTPAVFLYDAATGHDGDLFPASTANGDQVNWPLISPDGTHVVAEYASASNASYQGIVIKQISADASTTITSSDIHVTYLVYELQLLSVSTNGSDFASWADDPAPARWLVRPLQRRDLANSPAA